MEATEFLSRLSGYTGIYIIAIAALAFASEILLALAVYKDAKARDIVNPILFFGVTILGSIPAAIAYAVVRNKQARAEEIDKAQAGKAKACLVFSIIALVLAFVSIIVFVAATTSLAVNM